MNTIAISHSRPRPLPVRWLDAPVIGPLPIVRREDLRCTKLTGHAYRYVAPGAARAGGYRRLSRGWNAFTLLELMMVIAIIGFIATLALPHVRGYGQANSMNAATRQLLDDVALARQRAMVNRSTVYMVFVPPSFWTNGETYDPNYSEGLYESKQGTNLVMHQYSAYAMITLASIGDQPGQHYPQYVTDWRVLPEGVFISPIQFTNLYTNTYIYTTNTLSGTIFTNLLQPWAKVVAPFPSLYLPHATAETWPCIAFSPQGSLATTYTDQDILLAHGSIFYPTDTNGNPQFDTANLVETPPGNDTNNPNMIQIDWMTARATLFRNQLQ